MFKTVFVKAKAQQAGCNVITNETNLECFCYKYKFQKHD